jgi:exonuclease SbcC
MRVLNVHATNFGSYRQLELNLQNAGLVLIHGKTGSGKSTVPDVVCWALYGKTAKNGSVDDVRNWENPNTSTQATIQVETSSGVVIVVTRQRGLQKSDLFWFRSDTPTDQIRGKNAIETQTLLEQTLGVSFELFTTGCYFNELSPTNNFFTSKVVSRRELFEKIAPLDKAVVLKDKNRENRKADEKAISLSKIQYSKDETTQKNLLKEIEDLIAWQEDWKKQNQVMISFYERSNENFQENVKKAIKIAQEAFDSFCGKSRESAAAITSLAAKLNTVKLEYKSILSDKQNLEARLSDAQNEKCKECGGPKNHNKADEVRTKLSSINTALSEKKTEVFTLEAEIKSQTQAIKYNDASANANYEAKARLEKEENNYAELLTLERNKKDPYAALIDGRYADLETVTHSLEKNQIELNELTRRLALRETLDEMLVVMKDKIMESSVKNVESKTNEILDTHFDSEIRIAFSVEHENFDTVVYKSGHVASFTQLSKGQRQLLKLAFGVAVQKVSADMSQTSLSNLFYDEALDGLDLEFKVKAFSLFEVMAKEKESVVVIDHSPDFQQLFDTKYRVTMENDASVIEIEQ